MQSLPTEKITKKPIPDEHLILKTTFEGLIQKCLAAATDPVSTSYFAFSLGSALYLAVLYFVYLTNHCLSFISKPRGSWMMPTRD